MNEKSIVFLPRTAGMAAPWRKLSGDGYVIGRGELAAEAAGGEAGEWVLVVPAEDVAVRWLTLSHGNAEQQVVAARWQMAEQLGHALADDEVVLGCRAQDGSTPVAVVRRSLLAAWRSWGEGAGLNVTSIVPAQLCAPIDEGLVHIVKTLAGDTIVSATGLSVAVSSGRIEPLVGEQTVSSTPAEQSLDVLALGAIHKRLNLLSNAGSSSERPLGWKHLTVLAAVLFLSPVWLGLVDVAHNKWMQRQADKKASAQAVAYFPDLAGKDDALELAQRRLSVQPPLGSYIKALAALTGVVEPKSGTLAEITGANGELRGVLRLNSPDDAGLIRDEMLAFGLGFKGCEPVSEDGRSVCAFVLGAV